MSDTNSGAADAAAADASGPAALKVCPRNTQHVRYFSTKPSSPRTILVRARVVFIQDFPQGLKPVLLTGSILNDWLNIFIVG